MTSTFQVQGLGYPEEHPSKAVFPLAMPLYFFLDPLESAPHRPIPVPTTPSLPPSFPAPSPLPLSSPSLSKLTYSLSSPPPESDPSILVLQTCISLSMFSLP